MGVFVRHEGCDQCGSKDNKAVYEDGSSHCFGCGHTVPSKDHMKEQSKVRATVKKESTQNMQEKIEVKNVKEAIKKSRIDEIKAETIVDPEGFRGLNKDTCAYFGVRHAYDAETNELVEQYYPCTQEGQLVGYKIRCNPKDFYSIGRTGAECELFGQFRFNRGGKYVLIVEGELDQLSAYQMMKAYNSSRGSDFETAVVSATTGANSQKQIAAQYRFFDQFENIILCLDADTAGQKAVEKIIPCLPKGKVKIMKMRYKDPNTYLENGKQKEFVQDFYEAKIFVPVGVVGSNEISDAMREELVVEKIPLPPFMHKLQAMMAGGIPLGRIVNLGSASGTGKSTIVDELIYYWIFNSPHKLGVVTLEATVGQYGIKLLSRHISKKLELLDQTEALELINTQKIKDKEKELFCTKDQNPRFYLVDDRGGEVSNVQDAIENLIISCNAKVIVCDPISDVIASLPLDEQENFMSWQKGLVKSHNVTFINVCHTRKTGSGQKAGSTGADLHEEDLIGSSSLYKSAACNLMFSRDKEAEDELERNTTTMKATKIRWTGKTGIAGKYYYECETHTLYDLDDWLNANGGYEFK